ncbi:MAG: PDZ domain-containing protein [Acidobacteriota bacterium]
MIRRSLVVVLFALVSSAAATAQTPEPRQDSETKAFSMFFDSNSGFLGIETQEITKDNFSKFGLRDVNGVAVGKVIDGSPAQTAGLQQGDVITKVDGESVTSVRKLTRLLSEVAADHQIQLTVYRNRAERELTATLGRRPMPKFDQGSFSMTWPDRDVIEFPKAPDFPQGFRPMPGTPGMPGQPFENFQWQMGRSRQIGVGITPLTNQLSDHFGVTNGVLINDVRPDSPAAKAGLKAGDIIVEADGKMLKGEGDLVRAISEKKDGDVELTIVRSRSRQTIRVTPEAAKPGFDNFFEFGGDDNAPRIFRQQDMPKPPATPMPMNKLFFPGKVI